MEDCIQTRTFTVIHRIKNWLRSCRFHPMRATNTRNKNGKRKATRKTSILTKIPVSVARKRQDKDKEEKLDTEVALSIGGWVTRSRQKEEL